MEKNKNDQDVLKTSLYILNCINNTWCSGQIINCQWIVANMAMTKQMVKININ